MSIPYISVRFSDGKLNAKNERVKLKKNSPRGVVPTPQKKRIRDFVINVMYSRTF